MKKRLSGLLPAFGMLLLILDTKTALYGAKDGIELCIMTVIPSLFPFFVLSILLTSSLSGLQTKFLQPIGNITGIPSGAESLLLIGLLGGYPTGAQAIAQAFQSKQISKEQARRMLGFCSNAGPAFIFGICGTLFPERWLVLLLWAIHIVSAVMVSILLPGRNPGGTPAAKTAAISLPQALDRALKTTARVCGWVVLFRILITFSDRWLPYSFSPVWKAFLTGLLELTNGCCQLEVTGNIGLRFLLASVYLAFGGLCVTMQTISVTGELGLGCYLRGKVLQTGFSVVLCLIVQAAAFPYDWKLQANPVLILIPSTILMLILLIYEKRSSNLAGSLV